MLARRWLILSVVMLAFLPVVIDMTILHIAVPSLTLALKASSTEVLWIIDVYPLLMAGLLVPMGALADQLGNRRILLTGLILFGIASMMAAFSTTPLMLIGARILLAFGGSMIMPCVLGIIRRTFDDDRERAMALGLWGTVSAAGAAIGPLVGGALLDHFWWGSVFLINVPLMVLIVPLAFALLPNLETNTKGKWAFGQAALLIAAITALVYSIKSGMTAFEPLLTVILVTLLGTAALTGFVRLQLRSPSPMLDLKLFSNPSILAGIVMAMFVTGALAGVELTLAMELQYVLDKTPLQAGIFMVPIMVAAAIGGPVAGFLSNRFGLRLVASLSVAISAICLALLAATGLEAPLATPVILAMLGLALSIGMTASSIAIMSSVDASRGAAAGALEATAYELGSGLGITFFGVFMSGSFAKYLSLPAGLSPSMAEKASHSIGESYQLAQELDPHQAQALIAAAKNAFTNTHSVLLSTASILLGLLTITILFLLSRAQK